MNPSPPISAQEEGQNGFLTVQIRTAGNALPVPGATVTVLPAFDEAGDPPAARVPIILLTDRSGNTPLIPLPSVSPSASLSPGSAEVSKRYHLIVSAPGYERAEFFYLPIFPGITAIQTVSLLPLPANASGNGQSFDQSPSPDL